MVSVSCDLLQIALELVLILSRIGLSIITEAEKDEGQWPLNGFNSI